MGNAQMIQQLTTIAREGNLPNVILCGPPGVGKTTCVWCMAKRMLADCAKDGVLELNASDERGIEVVREKIKNFAQQKVVVPKGASLVGPCRHAQDHHPRRGGLDDRGRTASPADDNDRVQPHHTISPRLQRLRQDHRAHPVPLCHHALFPAFGQGDRGTTCQGHQGRKHRVRPKGTRGPRVPQ